MDKLYLGVSRKCITPEIGCQLYGYRPNLFSESLADDLTATAFYFRQGSTQALMISITVCLIKTELAQAIAGKIEEKFGIPAGHCMLSATHTHSGPNVAGTSGWGDIDAGYCDRIFIPQIMAAVEEALQNARPVKMGTAWGRSLIGINRRQLDGKNRIILGQNPWGCFNPKMTVLSFVDEQGEIVANMVHYGLHGTAAGANKEITRDWSGIMIDIMEKEFGGITGFFNGPEGDVGPRLANGRTTGAGMAAVRELGYAAARDAVEVFRQVFSYQDVSLAVSAGKLPMPLQKRMPLEEARSLHEQYKDHYVNFGGMIRNQCAELIASYEAGCPDQEILELDQTVIALGDVVFAAFPYELFSEIGMRIDGEFKTKSVLSLSNTNGSEGYFVTEDALCRGGYEVDMFRHGHLQPFCDNGDFHLMEATVAHIRGLTEGK